MRSPAGPAGREMHRENSVNRSDGKNEQGSGRAIARRGRGTERRGGVALLACAAACAWWTAAPAGATPSNEPAAGGAGSAVTRAMPRQSDTEILQKGQFRRLHFERTITDWAIADSSIASVKPLNDRELLLKGVEPGRTNLMVEFEDGPLEIPISVLIDLGVLADALADVHPSITAHKAPDREAIVLLGRVPLAIYATRAEEIARRYLEASAPQGEFLVGEAAAGVAEDQSRFGGERRRGARTVSVINLIRIENLPAMHETETAEQKILGAISGMPDIDVRVRRVMKGHLPDDEQDILILEGTVPDQVSLVRVLSVAYKVFYGARRDVDQRVTDGITQQITEYEGDIRTLAEDLDVIADEAGALLGRTSNTGSTSDRQLLSGFGRTSNGARSGVSSAGLQNRIQNNLGRAKAIELADGRLLSFLEVEDLPQVRVDIRLYEVNRTALFRYESDLAVLAGDFDQGGLNAAGVARDVQGVSAARVGANGKAVQNALGFLNGTASNQLQISGSHVALDSLFTLLEEEDIARSLAKPSLTVLSGETALFEVGGEVPINQSFATNDIGAQGVFNGVEFIEFGIKLAIRPLVDEKDFVTIDFAPEVTAPDAFLTAALAEATGENPSSFAFESRLLRTSARMLDGSTLLVGGLQQKNRTDASNQVPWLSKVPLLGLLFQGFEYSDDDLELVVMVRVSIVRDPIPEASLWAFPATGELLDGVLPPPVRARAHIHEADGADAELEDAGDHADEVEADGAAPVEAGAEDVEAEPIEADAPQPKRLIGGEQAGDDDVSALRVDTERTSGLAFWEVRDGRKDNGGVR